MSEHISITGEVEHWHMPQEIYAYCFRCKKEKQKLTIEINQGICGTAITARCPKCKRAIWTAQVDFEDMIYWHTKKDKKCVECGKKTNDRDCAISEAGSKAKYWCSDKCHKKWEKNND